MSKMAEHALSQREAQLERALRDLYEQVQCLDGVEFSRDLEPYKAEACWDYALSQAAHALRLEEA